MADFQRLGVLGDWGRIYRTMDFANEAGEIRVLKRLVERGFVYRGQKPVYWCFDCGSSLAEFEIEYADKSSPTVDVAFLAAEPDRLAAAFGLASLAKPAFAVIWTTTPWTLPANQALNLNPTLSYALVDTARGLLLLAEALVEKCLARYGLQGTVLATAQGDRARRHELPAPAGHVHAGYDRLVTGLPGRLRHRRRRHRHRALVAGLWRGRLPLLPGARHGGRPDPQPGAGRRRATRPRCRCSAA